VIVFIKMERTSHIDILTSNVDIFSGSFTCNTKQYVINGYSLMKAVYFLYTFFPITVKQTYKIIFSLMLYLYFPCYFILHFGMCSFDYKIKKIIQKWSICVAVNMTLTQMMIDVLRPLLRTW